MNLGSIIGLGSVCKPFPAGLTTLSGGHQWRSIDPWIQQSRSVDPSVSGSKCPELAPSSLLSLIRSWGAPQATGVSWKRPLGTYASQMPTANALGRAFRTTEPDTWHRNS
eukprot:scaffold7029_cov66-Phaeocystis_antarctica.AAC.2